MRRGEIKKRSDVHYNKPEYRLLVEQLLSRYPDVQRLDGYADVNCGPFGSEITSSDYVEQGVPLLRISNISKEGQIDTDELVFITETKASKLLSTQVKPGDIVISQRGTLGLPAVVPEGFPTSNISANLIAVRNLTGVSAEFVQLYFSSSVGGKQVERTQSGQVQSKITTEDVASVLVPQTPLESELVSAMQAARARRAAKLQAADAELAGIDGFLLEQLGLATQPTSSRPFFAVQLSELQKASRLNIDYFQPERIEAIRTVQTTNRDDLRSAPLHEIVDFVRDQVSADSDENYLGLANVQSNTGELVATESEVGGICFAFQRDDVLFGRLRPYLNKVYKAEQSGICSTEFHVMRLRSELETGYTLLPEYLATILRSSLVLAQTRHMMTGNTHPRLANEDVINLIVPIPMDLKVQTAIAQEVQRRRESARELREDAAREWEQAKAEFERRLLGAKK